MFSKHDLLITINARIFSTSKRKTFTISSKLKRVINWAEKDTLWDWNERLNKIHAESATNHWKRMKQEINWLFASKNRIARACCNMLFMSKTKVLKYWKLINKCKIAENDYFFFKSFIINVMLTTIFVKDEDFWLVQLVLLNFNFEMKMSEAKKVRNFLSKKTHKISVNMYQNIQYKKYFFSAL